MGQINADSKVNNWHEIRLYMDQSVKLKLDQGDTRSVKTGKGVRQGYCFSSTLINLQSQYLTKEAVEGFGDFRTGQVVCKVKHAEVLVLLAKEETVLQDTTDILIETGGCYEWK